MLPAAARLCSRLLPLLLLIGCAADDRPTMDNSPASMPPPDCGARTACGRSCVDLQTDPTSCGSCGRTCVIPHATAGCRNGECVIAACSQGYYDTDHKLSNGCEMASDCVSGSDCQTSCDSAGTTACDNGVSLCKAPAETCNGRDDDCNGRCDEGPLSGCRVGVHRSVGPGAHLYTTDLAAAKAPPYTLEVANYFHIYQAQVPGTQPVFLCQKPNGKYFLTGSSICEGLNIPGQQLGFWATDARCDGHPLYRLYNDMTADHFFTVSDDEQKNAVDNFGYKLEGVVGYVWLAP